MSRFWMVSAVVVALCGPAWAAGPDPLAQDAFSVPPAELLRIAAEKPNPAGVDSEVLYEEGRYSLEADGHTTRRYLEIYRVLTAQGAADLGSIDAGWAPWHEERPLLRARVITADGVAHALDPKTLTDSPVHQRDPQMYGDSRVLRAPLPAVAVGAVVEIEIVTSARSALPESGITRRFYFGSSVPTRHIRLVIDADERVPLHFVMTSLPGLSPVRREAGGRVELVFDRGQTAALKPREVGAPIDGSTWPMVAFSTGRSWSALAAAFRKPIEHALAGSDLTALAREAAGGRRTPEEIGAQVTTWVQHHVRYTGLELADAAFIPRTPAETLTRGYGDCKDQALLLAALLRRAGLPASVALLEAGPGPDLDPTLPGLGVLNHAIVRVAGKRPFWIDPTDELLPAGTLPPMDQGRLALVLEGRQSRLERTPEAPSSANRKIEQRDFFLSELGEAKVVETTQATGERARIFRNNYRNVDRKQLAESLQKYVTREYSAEKLATFDYSDPNDVSRPFHIRLEVTGAKRGSSGLEDAAVAIFPSALLYPLPDSMISSKEDGSADARTQDYQLAYPFQNQWHYRIVPAAGFVARPLPADESIALGPAHLSIHYSRTPAGEVHVDLLFDTVKARLSPTDFEAMRSAARELADRPPILILFDQAGVTDVAAGRVRKGLAELHQLIALHPNEALHRAQLSLALLQIGFGEAAREEASRATALGPTSGIAWRTAGWAFEHDLLGREHGGNWNPAQAEAAFRKAKALDPKDVTARSDLAILLEYAADGTRYRSGRLAESIAEYRAIDTDLQKHKFDENLLFALYWAGRYGEVESTAAKMGEARAKNQLVVAAVAAGRGPAAALAKARELEPEVEPRRALLDAAATQLLRVRRYSDSAALLDEAARGASDGGFRRMRADLIRRFKPMEVGAFPEKRPEEVVRNLFVRMFSMSEGALRLALHQTKAFALDATERQQLLAFEKLNIPLTVIGDALGIADFTREGDDRIGYWITMALPVPPFTKTRFYVARRGDRYELVSDPPPTLGAQALRLLQAGDQAEARKSLAWAAEKVPPTTSLDPYAGSAFVRLWQSRPTTPEELKIAAALLLAETGAPKPILPILTACSAHGATPALRDLCDWGLAIADGRLGRRDDLSPIVARLATRAPDSEALFGMQMAALYDHPDRQQALADARLRRLAGDPSAERALLLLAGERGDYQTYARLASTLIGSGQATGSDYNNAAWNALLLGQVGEPAIAWARKAVELSQRTNPLAMNTLAALLAVAGKPQEAHDLLIEALAGGEPRPADHLVLGLIAESYGLPGIARANYEQVPPPTDPMKLAQSSYAIAQRRLTALRSAGSSRAAR